MLTEKQRNSLKKLNKESIHPKKSLTEQDAERRKSKGSGTKMFVDLGDLKDYVMAEAKKQHIPQAEFIRKCIRENMERSGANAKSDSEATGKEA